MSLILSKKKTEQTSKHINGTNIECKLHKHTSPLYKANLYTYLYIKAVSEAFTSPIDIYLTGMCREKSGQPQGEITPVPVSTEKVAQGLIFECNLLQFTSLNIH